MRPLPAFAACALLALPLFAQRNFQEQKLDPNQQAQMQAGAAVVQQKPGDTAPVNVRGGTTVDRKAPAKDARPTPNDQRADPKAPDAKNLRNIAKQIVAMEGRHREILARMERLTEIYTQQGKKELVAELEELRGKWNNRYERAMDGYRAAVGPEIFAKIRAAMGAADEPPKGGRSRGAGRADFPPPEPAPKVDKPAPNGEKPRDRRGKN